MSAPAVLRDGRTGPFVDLHMHSTASDGSRSPAAVVQEAAAAGLSAIALTDHDTLDGLLEAQGEADRIGLRVIAGVEFSVVDDGREVHVLGLHLRRVAALDEALAFFRTARRRRAERIVERLNTLGIPLTLCDVLDQAGGGALGRPHVARALVSSGWARDQRDAFDRYLGAGRPANVEKHRLPMNEAISLIHGAGGLAVVAHPGAEGTRERLGALASAGIDGAEVLHPGHGAEDVARIGTLVEHFGMVPSGGSDWHGANEGARTIGAMRVPASWLDRQDERLRARLGAGAAHVA